VTSEMNGSGRGRGVRLTGCQMAVLAGVALFFACVCAVSGLAVGWTTGYTLGRSSFPAVRPPGAWPTVPPSPLPRRAYLGVWYTMLEDGARVDGVAPDSPADQAGLEVGDIILEVDGEPVTMERSLLVHIVPHDPGDVVVLTVERGGERIEIPVRLGERED